MGCRLTGRLLLAVMWVFGYVFGCLVCLFVPVYVAVAWNPSYLQLMRWMVLEGAVEAIEDFFDATLS